MDGNKRPSKSTEWRRHGNKEARLRAVLHDMQVAAELAANDAVAHEGAAAPPVDARAEHGSNEHLGQQVVAELAANDAVAHEGAAAPPVDARAEHGPNEHLGQQDNLYGHDFDSDSSICDMEMHYLEMEPNDENGQNLVGDPPDPEDPDDPHINYSSGEDRDDSDLENEDLDNFDFLNAALNEPVVLQAVPTVREMMWLDLALFLRHKHSYESLIDTFDSKNVAFGKEYFPTSKKDLWRLLGRNNSGIVEHIYCSNCGSYIGKRKSQGAFSSCPNVGCDFRIQTDKAKYFITLSLKCQLKNFLETPGVSDLLNYRNTRTKHQDGSIEDIYDSKVYQELQLGPNDFSGVINTDGCKIRKGAKLEIYPVLFRLNELPPLVRQKVLFLAAVFVDTVEPKMTSLLQPVVDQLNNLSEGVIWSKNGIQIQSKIKVVCFCVDGKARHQVLNMSTHQSHYGCTYCTFKGVTIGDANTMRYPILPHPDIPAFEDRTHAGMVQAILQVHETDETVLGHKGPTALMLLEGVDLRKSNACDDLHILYECAAKHITELSLTRAPRINERMEEEALCAVIDERLKKIKTPTNIARKPGNCKMKNRKQFKGSEWRNWLLYYAVPCLNGLIAQSHITPIEHLSYGAFLLSQDIISPEHILEADRCFLLFLQLQVELYGIENTKLNLHALIHLARNVADLGNLWCYTTSNFQSWYHRIILSVHSAQGALLQIVVRHLILMSVELALALHSVPNISPSIRAQISKILRKKRRARAHEFAPHVDLIGPSKMRDTTEEERQVLEGENMNNVMIVQEFRKLCINSTDYYPIKYVDPNTKSNNSLAYTYGDFYCSIQSVVRFQTDGGVDVCGCFVLVHRVSNQVLFNQAQHIACLLEQHNIPHFLTPDQIRTLVVKMPLHGKMYIAPLPNLNEID